MALTNGKLFLVLVISALMANTTTVVASRDLATTIHHSVGHNLAARINGEDGGAGMRYMSYDQMYLGIECCRAIRIITPECWLSMLTSVGFTAEEGDILRGYCDASHSTTPISSPGNMLPSVQTTAQSPFLGPSTPPPVVACRN
ncbi:hypothetical protein MKW98_021539 [Papaver atlanticum]|uniref:Prolamin-like domain-containing protein n=1 Tax=Papaver atlanticum TaxID=357466 RepID=A0AAD4RV41_9MAGN|nr:hypothetical protein MKW98_020327 [Papaver atlanticum]KAI3921309.1 hypothetical protein MKW98_021539 [Papaver atlanticum]